MPWREGRTRRTPLANGGLEDHAGSGPLAAAGIGFIEAGSMGGPMVERLLAAGVEVHLYARRAESADHFSSLGATMEPSIRELAGAVDTFILCPFSEE